MKLNRLESLMNAGERVLLVGPPGCGKTARILAAAIATGRKLEIIRASLSERVDIGGCLIPDVASGVTRSLPLETMHRLRTTSEPTLVLLDDLGQAPIDTQSSLMSLFDAGALPPNVVIWGATNRPQDRAGVQALCEPLRSRFSCVFRVPTPADSEASEAAKSGVPIGTWAEEVENWCDWSFGVNVPPEVVAFHRFSNGAHLYGWTPNGDPSLAMPDFRSWHSAIRLINHGLGDYTTLSATIGRTVARMYLDFAALASDLPTPDQVFMDPANAPLPSTPEGQWLISSALVARVTAPFAGQFVTYCARLPRHLTAFAAKSAFRKLGAALSGSPQWVQWWRENHVIFAD